MVVFPNAKINLGLYINARRPDGYHDIESCFYPVSWTDALEILPSQQLQFTSSGIPIPGSADDNLCLRAYHLLDDDYNLPPVHIHLHKSIPIGAGLGGGSSDAAFTLKVLSELFDLHLNEYALENYARQLGSDCAFFIRNKPVIAYEKGDVFRPSSLNLKGKYIVMVYPGIHVSTAEAYSGVRPALAPAHFEDMLTLPVSNWKNNLINKFESSVFDKYPALEDIKDIMYEAGALYASMSGSGSTIYGIFSQETKVLEKVNNVSWIVWQGWL